MGMNNSFYLGPYVELPKVKTLFNEEIKTCLNKSCKNNMKKFSSTDKFCNECGSEIVNHTKTIEKEKFFDFFDFEEKNGLPNSLFWTVGEIDKIRVLIPNVKFKYSITLPDDEATNMQINADYIARAIKEFEELFQGHKTKLKEVNNMELEVKFGVISYYI